MRGSVGSIRTSLARTGCAELISSVKGTWAHAGFDRRTCTLVDLIVDWST
jgi:hypothetical protein